MEKTIEFPKKQVPGYFRYMLGDYEITSIYDGYMFIDTDLYCRQEKEKNREQLEKGFAETVAEDGKVFTKLPLTIHLINTKKDLILIDAGGGEGGLLGPYMGLSRENIILSGYKPEDVTKILLTHLHQDHLGGMVIDGKLIYPNADIYINQEELDFWLDEKNHHELLTNALEPYIRNNKVKSFRAGEEIDGIKTIGLPGHTPGHTGYEVSSNGDSILFWGDIVHDHEIQFANRDAALVFVDYDENIEIIEQEVETGKAALKMAVKNKKLIGASHLPFPGIGHVIENGAGGYHWLPVYYSVLD